jgi:hypothetical protein
VRLREKGGKRQAMPCHHHLEEYVTAYLDGAGLGNGPKGRLFPTDRAGREPAHPHGVSQRTPSDHRPARRGARYRHQARQPQLPVNPDHRVSEEWDSFEKAAAITIHALTRTTQLHDRRRDEVSLDEVERIVV